MWLRLDDGKEEYVSCPEPNELVFDAKDIHIIVWLGGKHFGYVWVRMNTHVMEYWDSNKYICSRARKTEKNKKKNGSIVMEKLEERINK